MEPLSNLADCILILFLLAGLIGTFIPILPGPTLIAVGAIIHALMSDFQPLGWLPLTVLVLTCIITALIQTTFTGIGTHKFGGSKYGMIGGSIGLILGFFLPFPGGMIVGAFGGATLCELYFAKQKFKHAAKAGLGGVLGLLVSFFFEIAITFAMAIYIIILFY